MAPNCRNYWLSCSSDTVVIARAFSSEVDTGSRGENASKQGIRVPVSGSIRADLALVARSKFECEFWKPRIIGAVKPRGWIFRTRR